MKKLSFANKVKEIVRKIQKGKVLTYKEVAIKAGSPRAFRAVGTILKSNFDPNIPCHRVIRSDGKLGEYNRGGEMAKKKMLEREGTISPQI
jgi:methylated-DNA-[protein]-cysteine S-methyltransferase